MIEGLTTLGNAKIVNVEWHGDDAINVVYEDPNGGVQDRIVYRDEERNFRVASSGTVFSFDAGGKLLRLVTEAHRINGKAERFIQTALREWAYARSDATSHERAQALPGWSHMYNYWHRPHSGIRDKTPISRLKLDRNNLLRHHS